MRDIGGRTAHIKGDNLFKTSLFGGFYRPDNAAGRPGQNSVFALKQVESVKPPFDCINCRRVPLLWSNRVQDGQYSGAKLAIDRHRPPWYRRGRQI